MIAISKYISNYCEKAIIGLLLAAVAIIPLFFDIRLYSVFDLSKVAALYFFSIATLVIWTILLTVKHDFSFSHVSINTPILAYIAIFIIASVLIAIGIVMIYSSSAIFAYEKYHDSVYFLKRHPL